MSFSYAIKCVLVGNSGTGKTAMIESLISNKFLSYHQTTIGVGFNIKNLILKDDLTVKLQIWDTAGLERFHSITKSYFRTAAIAIIIYDISNKKSFDDVKYWYELLLKEGHNDLIITIVGNKTDLNNREVSYQNGIDMVKSLNSSNKILFFETSVKNQENVNKVFEETSNQIFDRKLNFDSPNTLYKNGITKSLSQKKVIVKKRDEYCCSLM